MGVRRAEQRGGQWGRESRVIPVAKKKMMPGCCLESGTRDQDMGCLAQWVEGLHVLRAVGKHGRVEHSAFFSL